MHGRAAAIALALTWLGLAAMPGRAAYAQFYEKVDMTRASADALVAALGPSNPSLGATVAALASCNDPDLRPVFRAMAEGSDPAVRVYGVLGDALCGKSGIDLALYRGLPSPEERTAIIREANVSGILRQSDAAALLAAGGSTPAAILALIGELDRRGEAWDPAQVRPILEDPDPVAQGAASLLLLGGPKGGTPDPAPWAAFRARLDALPESERWPALRALVEAAMVFELEAAADPLMERCEATDVPEQVRVAGEGLALRLSPERGLAAWRARVAAERTQVALVRAGLQLLASVDHGVPPTAFDEVRNGSPVLDAIADAGAALARREPPAPVLIALLDAGHPASAEWALLRAAALPPAESDPIWKHLLDQLEHLDPLQRPSPVLVAGLSRELVRSDPAAVDAAATALAGQDMMLAALVAGLWDSRSTDAAPIARRLRGTLPRSGESLAAMVLAHADATLTDDDREVLARAGAGGGDLDPTRALQAAWYAVKSAGTADGLPPRLRSTAPARTPEPAP